MSFRCMPLYGRRMREELKGSISFIRQILREQVQRAFPQSPDGNHKTTPPYRVKVKAWHVKNQAKLKSREIRATNLLASTALWACNTARGGVDLRARRRPRRRTNFRRTLHSTVRRRLFPLRRSKPSWPFRPSSRYPGRNNVENCQKRLSLEVRSQEKKILRRQQKLYVGKFYWCYRGSIDGTILAHTIQLSRKQRSPMIGVLF